jgi:hypothetical protein
MGENSFLPIKLPWGVHPERDQSWRDRQDQDLGIRMAAQECDCDFSTSGDTVFVPEDISFYEQTYITEPLEKRGLDQNLWVWEPVDYSRDYMVVADVARGDGKDYSTFHVFDSENFTQVAEYRGQLNTKEFGHLLVGIATEYNNALLAPENSNIGWSTIQTILERGYTNLYYSPKSGNLNSNSYFDPYLDTKQMVPGFTMSSNTRPIAIGKFQEAIGDRGIVIRSHRLMEEMKVFLWKNGRAEAQNGYNDDLVMACSIGCYLRETSFKLRQHGMDMSRNMLDNIATNKSHYDGAYNASGIANPYKIENPYTGGSEDISWLL